jgi:putative ABC transport system permease protein
MLRKYFTVAWRNIVRGKLYSAINITGLGIGLACFFLIALFIKDELSYDRFHTKANRIYRVIGILDLEGQGEQSSSCPFPVGPALANDYPDMIEHMVRFFNFQDPQHTLKVGDTKINESRIFMTDSNVFSLFDFPLDKGDRNKVLAEPNTIVITHQLAEKYFGKEDPIGKVIKFDGAVDLRVTGILGEIPQQSHIHFDGLISFSTMRTMMPHQLKNWVWNPNWTYVLLKDGVQPARLETQFPEFVKKYYPDFLKPQVRHLLQPLADIHLHSKYEYEIEPNSDISSIYIFSIIGIFILAIACINFMNLATARSANRAKEVGVRKVSGANKSQLVKQFLIESILLALIATLLSLLLAELLLPFFNHISGKQITLSYFANAGILLLLVLAGLITGLFSGLYPAFYLSTFEPVRVLKGSLSSGSRNIGLRKALVVFQFAISVALIIGTGMVYLQLKYMRSAELGFNKEQVLMLPVRPPMGKMFDPFIEELKGLKQAANVTRMNDVIGKHHNTHEYNYAGMQPGKWIYYPSLLVDEEFVPAMQMEILAGRNFSKAFPRDDSLAVIVNESMVKHMGWGSNEKAIGQQFYTPSGYEKIVGVVKDFNYEPLHKSLGPFVLDLPHPRHKIFWTRYIAIRLKPGDVSQTISEIGTIWNRYSQEYPYEYFFLNDDLNKQYKAQENLGKLVAGFSALAIIIACLGLFALASFSAEQRTKEIGIRKVMGASAGNIAFLLSVDFLKLVLIANIISWPISWYFVNEWLKGFAYRADFNWVLLLFAALLTIGIALITVIFQALKAALSNPVKSLRYE